MYHKQQSYDVWFLRYGVRQTKFFGILDHFLHFYLPNNPKNQNFETMKKSPENIIILHMCIINDNHMMYGSWDMEHKGQNFLILGHFLPFYYPLNNPKNQIWKKRKKPGNIIIFHKCTINENHVIWCMVPEICSMTDRTFCYFGPFFALLPL